MTTGDLAFVAAHIANYRGYDDEQHRHDSDMRVRAYVGEALTNAQTRLGATFAPATKNALEAVLYRCMFTDQAFTRKFDHAEVDTQMASALVHSDRLLIDYADDARNVSADDLPALLHAIDEQFDARRSPNRGA